MPLPIAGHWFERRRIDDDVTLIYEPHVVSLMRCNIWHVRGRDRDLMIDTGAGVVSLRAFARDILDKPVTAVATHVHADHIGNHHEFDECLVHECEAEGLLTAGRTFTLAGEEFDACDLATLFLPAMDDYVFEGPLITALPHAGYDLSRYRIPPEKSARTVKDGDSVDLGDRAFEVLHLPGHSPGGIGLWEERTGTLFSGDAIYDSALLDTLHHSSIPDYINSFERLRALPISVVHAGHDLSFGRDRLMEITAGYLKKWRA
jgi:glyoxylase-like metal-dependent hydrolase (beta-lactamase superfamily II)